MKTELEDGKINLIEKKNEEKEDKENKEEKKEDNNDENEEQIEDNGKKNEELKEKKKLYAIIFLSALIVISLILFFFIFDFFPDLSTATIECTYYSPGEGIYILNPDFTYEDEEKDDITILINDKEIDKKEKYKTTKGDFNVTIKINIEELDMSYMFSSQNIKTFRMKSKSENMAISNMTGSFENCQYLEKFEIDEIDTSKVNSMAKLFNGATKLKEVNMALLNTSSLENVDYMFADTNISEINLTNFDVEKILSSNEVFKGWKNKTKVIINQKYNKSKGNLTAKYSNIIFDYK